MKKRIISMILAISLLLTMLPQVAIEVAATSGSCGKTATWRYEESTKTLIISGNGDISFSESVLWSNYRNEIEILVIGEGVRPIYPDSIESLILILN